MFSWNPEIYSFLCIEIALIVQNTFYIYGLIVAMDNEIRFSLRIAAFLFHTLDPMWTLCIDNGQSISYEPKINSSIGTLNSSMSFSWLTG